MNEGLKELFEEGEKAQKELDKFSGGRVTYFNLEKGKNKYRIPFTGEKGAVVHESKHFGFKDGEGKSRSFVCTMAVHGRCPMCEEAVKAKEIGDPLWYKKRATPYYYMYALNEAGEAGVLQMDKHCFPAFKEFVKRNLEDKDLGERDVTGLESGCYLIINRGVRLQGTAEVATYDFQKVDRIHSMTKADFDNYFGSLPKLVEVNKKSTPEELDMVLDGDFSFMKKKEDKDTDFDPKKMEGEKAVEEKSEKTPVKEEPKKAVSSGDELDDALDL